MLSQKFTIFGLTRRCDISTILNAVEWRKWWRIRHCWVFFAKLDIRRDEKKNRSCTFSYKKKPFMGSKTTKKKPFVTPKLQKKKPFVTRKLLKKNSSSLENYKKKNVRGTKCSHDAWQMHCRCAILPVIMAVEKIKKWSRVLEMNISLLCGHVVQLLWWKCVAVVEECNYWCGNVWWWCCMLCGAWCLWQLRFPVRSTNCFFFVVLESRTVFFCSFGVTNGFFFVVLESRTVFFFVVLELRTVFFL